MTLVNVYFAVEVERDDEVFEDNERVLGDDDALDSVTVLLLLCTVIEEVVTVVLEVTATVD